VIGDVDIDIRNIFDERDPRERDGLFRLANRPAHPHQAFDHTGAAPVRQRRQVQRAQARGNRTGAAPPAVCVRRPHRAGAVRRRQGRRQGADQGRVDLESGHLLRPQPAARMPRISTCRTRTSWAGEKRCRCRRGSTVDRTSDTVAWTDPNVLGSRWTSALAYSDSSDGSERSVQIIRPFYSLDAPWSTKITAVDFNRTISRYNLGDIVDQFNDNESSYELSGGCVRRPDRRLDPAPAPSACATTATSSCPRRSRPCRRGAAAGPHAVISLRRLRFSAGQVQESRRRESDRPHRGLVFRHRGLGRSGSIRTAHSARTATPSCWLAKALRGIELTELQQLFLTSDFSSRIEDGRARNLIADAGAKYYWRWRQDWLLYAGAFRNGHRFTGPGYAAAARRRQRPARLPAAL
jgi:hypothetical protein